MLSPQAPFELNNIKTAQSILVLNSNFSIAMINSNSNNNNSQDIHIFAFVMLLVKRVDFAKKKCH